MAERRRTAIVTGGAKGIGRAISEALAEAGWDLVLVGRDGSALEVVASTVSGRHGVRVTPIRLDLSEEGTAGTLLDRWADPAELPLAMVCGAADYGTLGPLASVEFAAWKRSFDLNFFSTAELIHRYVRIAMRGSAEPRRRIAVICGAGLGAGPVSAGVSAYSCSKAALNRLVEVVDEEVRGHGIDVNAVLPGLVDTGIVDQAIAAGPSLGPIYEASARARAGGGVPAEVPGRFVARLLDDRTAGLSGRLLSARWDGRALETPDAVGADPDLFRLRRVDDELFARKPR